MQKTRIMPEKHWDWSMPVSFSQGWKVGNLVFVGGQVAFDENRNIIGEGDIEAQTHAVFQNIRKVLSEVGADMEDIVKFNTYYKFDGVGDEVNSFWQKMTDVRLEYLPEPGPVGTAIRVEGFGTEGLLIEVDAIAVVNNGKK